MINGALITATQDCILEIGSGAHVVTGRGLWRNRGASGDPGDELYYSLLDVATEPAGLETHRFRLFRLLSQVVAQKRTREVQRECTYCASALRSGDIDAATKSAARLTSRGGGQGAPSVCAQRASR